MAQSELLPGRTYPEFVTIVNRICNGPSVASDTQSISDVEDWLLGAALEEADIQHLTESFFWRLVAAGLPLNRASSHIGTLHPQLIGFAWNWNTDDQNCDEVKVAAESLDTDAYRRNPLYRVVEFGESFFADMTKATTEPQSPLIQELAASGFTNYLIEPLQTRGSVHNSVSMATRQPGGFTSEQLTILRRLMAFYGLHLERHIMERITENVSTTYLGALAGRHVLEGSIKRGAGSSVEAVIWASDLRGFTDLSERLSGPDVTAVLNAYFERQVDAVLSHGGEVLKFIGDGLLAAFPFEEDGDKAAQSALAAAQDALKQIAAINECPPENLTAIEGWNPLKTGIGLHEGTVFFGNVGGEARLDFTVIGRAVNVAARVEALTKDLKRPILMTELVATRLRSSSTSIVLEDCGAHALKGLQRAVHVFSPSE